MSRFRRCCGILTVIINAYAEGLDPIYALEAKFSLLQAIAQSKLGADKLVSEGLFEVLGKCTFIGARPDGEEAIAGTCSIPQY